MIDDVYVWKLEAYENNLNKIDYIPKHFSMTQILSVFTINNYWNIIGSDNFCILPSYKKK